MSVEFASDEYNSTRTLIIASFFPDLFLSAYPERNFETTHGAPKKWKLKPRCAQKHHLLDQMNFINFLRRTFDIFEEIAI